MSSGTDNLSTLFSYLSPVSICVVAAECFIDFAVIYGNHRNIGHETANLVGDRSRYFRDGSDRDVADG